MVDINIGLFSVTITHAELTQGIVERTSGASVVAGLDNVELGLTLKDEYGNLVSGSYTIDVNTGAWFSDIVVFTDGVGTITFAVTLVGVYVDIPVKVVIV